jgi:hypothetical protein
MLGLSLNRLGLFDLPLRRLDLSLLCQVLDLSLELRAFEAVVLDPLVVCLVKPTLSIYLLVIVIFVGMLSRCNRLVKHKSCLFSLNLKKCVPWWRIPFGASLLQQG